MTITEALAEIKTIGKRLEKKRTAIIQNLGRDSRLMDRIEGGSVEYVRAERQSIGDLEQRIVAIRTAIQRSNLSTIVSLDGRTRSVAEWLTYRREVAPGQGAFLTSINRGIREFRDKIQKEGGRVTSVSVGAGAVVSGEKAPVEFLLHIDEIALLKEQEDIEKVLGDLDGKLSLLNATTVIEV